MGNCGGILAKEPKPRHDQPRDGPPGHHRKHSHDDKRRGSNDSHGKGHGHGHGRGHEKH